MDWWTLVRKWRLDCEIGWTVAVPILQFLGLPYIAHHVAVETRDISRTGKIWLLKWIPYFFKIDKVLDHYWAKCLRISVNQAIDSENDGRPKVSDMNHNYIYLKLTTIVRWMTCNVNHARYAHLFGSVTLWHQKTIYQLWPTRHLWTRQLSSLYYMVVAQDSPSGWREEDNNFNCIFIT